MSFRRARRIAVRHRGDADGVIKVACGKGAAFYANEGGLTKRKSPAGQRLPHEFDLWNNAKFGPKGSGSLKNLSASRGCDSGGSGSLAPGHGDGELAKFSTFIVGQLALVEQLLIPPQHRLERQHADGRRQLQRGS